MAAGSPDVTGTPRVVAWAADNKVTRVASNGGHTSSPAASATLVSVVPQDSGFSSPTARERLRCECGNFFMYDSLYCRKCGRPRQDQERPSGTIAISVSSSASGDPKTRDGRDSQDGRESSFSTVRGDRPTTCGCLHQSMKSMCRSTLEMFRGERPGNLWHLGPHFVVLSCIASSDALFYSHRCEACPISEAAEWLGVLLLFLYAAEAMWLLAALASSKRQSCRAWLESLAGGLACGLWVALAALHTALALTSAWWREAVAGSDAVGLAPARATCVAGMLQLLVLLPSRGFLAPVHIAVLWLLSQSTLVAVQAAQGHLASLVMENSLLLLSMGFVCAFAASQSALGRMSFAGNSGVDLLTPVELLAKLELVLGPVSKPGANAQFDEQVSTHLDRLVIRLHWVQESIHRELRDSEIGLLFVDVFHFLLTELSQLDTMAFTEGLANASPMTQDFVKRLNGCCDMNYQAQPNTECECDECGECEPPLESEPEELLSPTQPSKRSCPAAVTPGGVGIPSESGASIESKASSTVSPLMSDKSGAGDRQMTSPAPGALGDNKEQAGALAAAAVSARGSGSTVDSSSHEQYRQRGRASTLPIIYIVPAPTHWTNCRASADCPGYAPAAIATSALSEGTQKVRVSSKKAMSTKPSMASYDQAVDALFEALRLRGLSDEVALSPAHPPTEQLQRELADGLGMWNFDMFRLSELSGGRPLVTISRRALLTDRSGINQDKFGAFIQSIESRYRDNPYHNSMHGADVLNNMAFFLPLLETGARRCSLEPIEKLAALVASGAHDVGHNGRSNPYHVTSGTALAMLYNDQSVLENMHSAIVFAVLQVEMCNFLSELAAPQRATFRSCVTHMILETDLSKHVQALTKFRQSFLVEEICEDGETKKLEPPQRKELLSFALKCCDVAHSTKPFDLHVQWTLRINAEFFQQGDAEKTLGIPFSPFCNRNTTKVAESQRGFFDFIVMPLFNAMSDYVSSIKMELDVFSQLEQNRGFWKSYDGTDFDYSDPQSNADMLRRIFKDWQVLQREQEKNDPPNKSGSMRKSIGATLRRSNTGMSQQGSSRPGFGAPGAPRRARLGSLGSGIEVRTSSNGPGDPEVPSTGASSQSLTQRRPSWFSTEPLPQMLGGNRERRPSWSST